MPQRHDRPELNKRFDLDGCPLCRSVFVQHECGGLLYFWGVPVRIESPLPRDVVTI